MRKLIMLIGLSLMLLFAGCSSGGTGSSSSGGSYNPSSSFNGGTKAITMEFLNNAPPEKVRDQGLQTFSIRLMMKNEGEFDISENSGYVVLDGFDLTSFGVTESTKSMNEIRGFKKQGDNLIPGGQQQVSFDSLKYLESVGGGSLPLTLGVKACYLYQTRATTLLCINGDTIPSFDDTDSICDIEGAKVSGTSGGPLTVENVQQYPDGTSSIRFQFDVVHNPRDVSSKLYESSALNSQCVFGNDMISKKDRIHFKVETGLSGLKCGDSENGEGFETLYDNKATIFCTQDTAGQNEFEKPVFITLDYAYTDRVTSTINVEHYSR